MSVFRFSSGSAPLDFTGGVPIENIERSTWVEKYRDFGTFKLEASLYTGLLDLLPIGSVVGHEGRLELMVVENQEIVENPDGDAKITITGRSLDSIMTSRIAGASSLVGEDLLSDYTINQSGTNYGSTLVKELLDNELITPADSNDLVRELEVIDLYNSGTEYSMPRVIQRTTLSTPVAELLAQDNLGLKVVRPHDFNSRWKQNPSAPTMFIHKGQDVSDLVGFSYFQGDVEQANYLWSRKSDVNAVLVTSKFCSVLVDDGVTQGFDRNYALVDASYLDEQDSDAPTGGRLTEVLEQMTARGREELSGRNSVMLVEVDISQSALYQYEVDYSMGDLVNVHANYGVSQKMRVVEYATIFDNMGYTGFPTLSSI